jgi:hypothetical protein
MLCIVILSGAKDLACARALLLLLLAPAAIQILRPVWESTGLRMTLLRVFEMASSALCQPKRFLWNGIPLGMSTLLNSAQHQPITDVTQNDILNIKNKSSVIPDTSVLYVTSLRE